MLKDFHVDVLFAGCDGAESTSGFYTSDLSALGIDKLMMSISDYKS